MDISLKNGASGFTILGIIGLGCLILAFKIFGYVLAIAEALFGVLVLLFYLKLLFNAIRRKDKKFIIISLCIIAVGVLIGFMHPLEVANIALRFPYSSLFYSGLFLAIAGMFYVIDIPIYTGEKGGDFMMLIVLFLALFGIIYVFCFIIQLSGGIHDMYSDMKWLVQNSYLDERYEVQTKKGREVLEEFVASANGNQELLKDEDALKDLAEKYCYIAEIREDEETGEIIYLIENNVNPDEEYTTQKYILDMSTLTLEYGPQI